LQVWTSTLTRTIQTAQYINHSNKNKHKQIQKQTNINVKQTNIKANYHFEI